MSEKKVVVAKVVITEEEYRELLEDQGFLNSLRYYGVDNWMGWDEACSDYNQWLKSGKLDMTIANTEHIEV